MQTTRANTPTVAGVPGRPAGGGRLARSSTPARLRAWQAGVVLGGLLLAVLGAYGVGRRSSALDDVRSAAEKLITVQDIRVSVVRADAIASSSYLAGGQEDPQSRTDYLEAIETAGRELVSVAGGVSGADADGLSEASRLLARYVGLIEQARANNRQGFPVGAAYQRQANALVSNDDPQAPDIVSSLRAVEDSLRDQVNSSLRAAHRAGAWFNVVGWLELVALVIGALWLARHFHRLVNVPLALAAVLLLLLLVVGGAKQATAVSDADDAVTGVLTTADRAAQARAAGFDARSQEALTLINRGNGQANEDRWQTASATVNEVFDRCQACAAGQPDFAAYEQSHQQLRALDDGGDWDAAVKLSLGPSDLVKQFNGFATSMADVISTNAASADHRLDDAGSSLGALRIITLIVGIVVAVLAAVGFGQRLREYR